MRRTIKVTKSVYDELRSVATYGKSMSDVVHDLFVKAHGRGRMGSTGREKAGPGHRGKRTRATAKEESDDDGREGTS